MKKYKKNILIIVVAFFVLLGMSPVVVVDDVYARDGGSYRDWGDNKDEGGTTNRDGSYRDWGENEDEGGTIGDEGGGTTDPGTGNGDDQDQGTKQSVSSSITVKVVNKEPVCSTETYYKCEIGEVVESSKKQDTERGKDLYTWQCEGGEGTTPVPCVFFKTEPEPNQLACGDLSYIDNNNWKGGCKGGNLVEGSKEHDLTTNTFSWKCQGDSPEKIIPCKHTLEVEDDYEFKIILDGICGPSPYSCLEGEVKGEKYKNDLFNWECHGYNGGETDYCEYINEEEPNPIDGICGEKLYGCNEGKLNKLSEKIDGYYWECLGRNGGEKDSCFEKKPSINGQCGPAQGQHYSNAPKEKDLCLTGEIVGPTKTGENNSWTWQCAGSNGGKTANCQTLLISLSPKFSGCYIKEGESSCEPEDKYSWIASGLDSLLSLFTNMGIFKLDSYSGSRSLSIKYPMSDIFLKRGEEELAQSRAWAICGHGLYWEEKSNKCVAPIEEEIDNPEDNPDEKPEKIIPLWKKGEAPACKKGQDGELYAIYQETCEGYDKSKGLFCRDEDGDDYEKNTREFYLDCKKNKEPGISLNIEFYATRYASDLKITESNPTENDFYLKWKASASSEDDKPVSISCENIKQIGSYLNLFGEVSTEGKPEGTAEVKNNGSVEGTLRYELTCTAEGEKDTKIISVGVSKRTGSQTAH